MNSWLLTVIFTAFPCRFCREYLKVSSNSGSAIFSQEGCSSDQLDAVELQFLQGDVLNLQTLLYSRDSRLRINFYIIRRSLYLGTCYNSTLYSFQIPFKRNWFGSIRIVVPISVLTSSVQVKKKKRFFVWGNLQLQFKTPAYSMSSNCISLSSLATFTSVRLSFFLESWTFKHMKSSSKKPCLNRV